MEYIVGIILIIGFIVYKMYKKGRAITDTYIIASEKALIIFAEDPYGVLKSLCQQGDNFPTSKRILRDYELFKDFQMTNQTLSHEEKELFAEDISFAMLGLITFFIYGENRTEQNRTEQNRTEQNRTLMMFIMILNIILSSMTHSGKQEERCCSYMEFYI